ncbi:hypothetical protein FRC10_006481 [Ceratobasidium sp. 414]|nr:hypothetical protein FRC10_006481 [Ceratobasidium sp. 414]
MGQEGRKYRDRSLNEPFNNVLEQVRQGHIERPSYTSRLLESKGGANITEEDLNLVKWTAGSMFSAGSSTTVGVVLSFYLMMALHPEISKIVQAEIDAVVGRARIPELSDREALPFLEATLQEVMRLCTVVPLGT